MKKILSLLLIATTFFACNQSKNNITISGEIKKMGNGEIYFIPSGDVQKIDTVKVVNDKFSYEGNVTEPTVYMANFGADQKPAFLIVEEGKISLNYEMNNFESIDIKGGKEKATAKVVVGGHTF